MRAIRGIAIALLLLLPLEARAEPRGFAATLAVTFYSTYGTQYPVPALTVNAQGIGDSVGGGDVSLPAGLFPIAGSYGLLLAPITGFAVCAAGQGSTVVPGPTGLGTLGGCGTMGAGTTGPLAYSAATQSGTMPVLAGWYPFDTLPLAPPSKLATAPRLSLGGIGVDLDTQGVTHLTWENQDVFASFTGNFWRTTPFHPFQDAPTIGISGFDARAPDGTGVIELLTTSYHTISSGTVLEAVVVLRLTITFGAEDFDGDGLVGTADNCPLAANPGQEDGDADAVGDACDNCAATPNPDQLDRGGLGGPTPDGVGDLCQNGDFNGDGTVDVLDSTLLRRALSGEEAVIAPTMPPTP